MSKEKMVTLKIKISLRDCLLDLARRSSVEEKRIVTMGEIIESLLKEKRK